MEAEDDFRVFLFLKNVIRKLLLIKKRMKNTKFFVNVKNARNLVMFLQWSESMTYMVCTLLKI